MLGMRHLHLLASFQTSRSMPIWLNDYVNCPSFSLFHFFMIIQIGCFKYKLKFALKMNRKNNKNHKKWHKNYNLTWYTSTEICDCKLGFVGHNCRYRVSHIDMSESKWFWGVEGSIILLILLWRHVLEFWPLYFIQVPKTGLHSLRKWGHQIS